MNTFVWGKKCMIKVAVTLSLFCVFLTSHLQAQLSITYSINTANNRSAISPYIYGFNTGNDPLWSRSQTENIGSRRLGGNRFTAYDWENNFSNAGSDYGPNDNDAYIFQETNNQAWNANPGEVLKIFHDTSLAVGAYSLLTVPMAGYVSIEQFKNVTTAAPSADWNQIIPAKGSAFTLTPSNTDGVVYGDEMINWVKNRYGAGSTSTGVKGYSLDNEPDYWYSTHPLIHPVKVGCQELIDKSTATAKAIKNVDPTADVFGFVSFGYSGYVNLVSASDWNSTNFLQSKYPWYIDAYLDKMNAASTTAGKRLVDVLDLHWYTEHRGLDNTSTLRRVYGDGTAWENDPGVCQARMQAPRSFWDPNFIENSWITSSNGNKAIQLIPTVQAKINTWWPGTKLSFSEWSFSGTTNVSGGIATADMLGILGKYGIYYSSIWAQMSGYISSGYKLFRNYDGSKNTFENTSVQAAPGNTSDYANTSIYASVNSSTDARLHLVVLNKHWTNSINATFNITSSTTYKNAKIYAFNSTSSAISLVQTITGITGNSFTYSIPNITALHIVLDNGSPLPVELLDFSGSLKDDREVVLNWEVTGEENVNEYEIWKSDRDSSWKKLASVKATGYLGDQRYAAADDNISDAPTIYYKLNSIDNNGQVSQSKVIAVSAKSREMEVQIYPNPSESEFNILVSNGTQPETHIRIINALGEVISDFTTAKNMNAIQLQAPAGIYIAEVSNGSAVKQIKIFKR